MLTQTICNHTSTLICAIRAIFFFKNRTFSLTKSLENVERCCHQKRVLLGVEFSENRLVAGLRSDPLGSLYSAPPDPVAGFGDGRGAAGMGRGQEGRGRREEMAETREGVVVFCCSKFLKTNVT